MKIAQMKAKDGTEPDGSLEGLDDIDGDVDDAWREAVLKLQAREQSRAAKERQRAKALPRRVLTLKEKIAEPFSYKHIMGRHSQKRHGRRGGSTEGPEPDVQDHEISSTMKEKHG